MKWNANHCKLKVIIFFITSKHIMSQWSSLMCLSSNTNSKQSMEIEWKLWISVKNNGTKLLYEKYPMPVECLQNSFSIITVITCVSPLYCTYNYCNMIWFGGSLVVFMMLILLLIQDQRKKYKLRKNFRDKKLVLFVTLP